MKKILQIFYGFMAITYTSLSIIYPTDPATIARRNFNIGEARIAALAFAFTLIAIWYFALYGSLRLYDYSRKVKDSKDGLVFVDLANGILLFAVFLPVRSVIKIGLNYISDIYPSLISISHFVITYSNIIIPLAAYLIISRGAYRMFRLAKAKLSLRGTYVLVFIVCLLSITYTINATHATSYLTPSDWLILTNYNIPLPYLVLTVLLPYLFMWTVGLLAAYRIYLYQKYVKGVFYRESLKYFSAGVALLIFDSIFVQYITPIASGFWKFPFGLIFPIAYLALILLALSYYLIARGVRNLNKLDEF